MEQLIDIGTGIYTAPEAARILNLSPQKVGAWVRRYWELEFLNDYKSEGQNTVYTDGAGREKVFNFYTLVELITVSAFRSLNVSFSKIKNAHKIGAEVLETRYPFAKKGFMTDGVNIIHNLDQVSSVLLDSKKQLAFRKLIEPYCNKIDFDQVNLLASRYWPMGRSHRIVIDPKHKFGEPTIADTNISASVINNFIKSGESVSFIAEEYGISEQAVKDAVVYFN